jgi:1,4-dihydroxy-6-naphthoate synthase
MSDRIIRVGHSPDPDDAFMFYGLASGKVKLDGIQIAHQLEDIQTLNVRAKNAELEVTAISAHTYPFVANNYWIMRTGASMGEGYGPVIISRRYSNLLDLRGKTVATPGPLTTATLLFKIFTEGIENVDMPFDKIMDAVDDGTVDAGLLIHEGQITYDASRRSWISVSSGTMRATVCRSRLDLMSYEKIWEKRWRGCFPAD